MEVAAVVTRSPARVRAVAEDLPGAAVLDSADRIWERAGDYDLVVVAAPNRAHASIAEASLRAGVAVVVDKPMATTAQAARRLALQSRETGVLLTVFHNRRWDNDFLTPAPAAGRRRAGHPAAAGVAVRALPPRGRRRALARERLAGGWRRPAAGPGQPPDRPGPGAVRPPHARVRGAGAPAPGRGRRRRRLRGAALRRRRAGGTPVDERPGPPARARGCGWRARSAPTSASASIPRRPRCGTGCGRAIPGGVRSRSRAGAG